MSVSNPILLRYVGLLQGALLWWIIQHVFDIKGVLLHYPILMNAIFWAILGIPAAIYLTEDPEMSLSRRGWLVAAIGLLYTGLGAYAGWLYTPSSVAVGSVDLLVLLPSPMAFLAAMALGFVLLALVPGRQSGQWSYPRLYAIAWRNAGLSGRAVFFLGVFWLAMYAGALLIDSLGISIVLDVIKKPIFIFPVSGWVIGMSFEHGHRRWNNGIVDIHESVLGFQAWFLPLIMVFGVTWVVVLPFTGLEPLLATRSAAFVLLLFTALAVYFLNCAFRHGHGYIPYSINIAFFLRYSWLVVPIVVCVPALAVYKRIAQHGLTEERIWACFILLMALGYSVGYAKSIIPQKELGRAHEEENSARLTALNWMPSVISTNIVMALVMVALLLLMITPVADPRRLAINDQLVRLMRGDVEPASFDYKYLTRPHDQWGSDALIRLSSLTGNPRNEDIASRARQTYSSVNKRPDGYIFQLKQ